MKCHLPANKQNKQHTNKSNNRTRAGGRKEGKNPQGYHRSRSTPILGRPPTTPRSPYRSAEGLPTRGHPTGFIPVLSRHALLFGKERKTRPACPTKRRRTTRNRQPHPSHDRARSLWGHRAALSSVLPQSERARGPSLAPTPAHRCDTQRRSVLLVSCGAEVVENGAPSRV